MEMTACECRSSAGGVSLKNCYWLQLWQKIVVGILILIAIAIAGYFSFSSGYNQLTESNRSVMGSPNTEGTSGY